MPGLLPPASLFRTHGLVLHIIVSVNMTPAGLLCRAIYDQSPEDVAWHVGDNNGMPLDSSVTADTAHPIVQNDKSNGDSFSERVKSALQQAANMDAAAEESSGQGSWQKGSALQTIALDEHDLPTLQPQEQVCWLQAYAAKDGCGDCIKRTA